MKMHKFQIFEKLIRLAVDAYNDLRIGTISGRSWPARHLSNLHASNQVARLQNSISMEAENFQSFNPSSNDLHYISPQIYAEMCHVIGDIELEKLKNLVTQSSSIGIQIDCSQNQMKCDIKHMTGRLWVDDEFKTVLLGIFEPAGRGLLESVRSIFQIIRVELKTEVFVEVLKY
jgi:hypothetical protein